MAVAWVVVLGLVFGSFLNVVIARVPTGESIVRPRSRCPKCGHTLAWFDNVPVLSWLVLRGRCRSCGQPISWRYPLIELLTGALFFACQRRFGWTPELVSALVLVLVLVPLSFIDLEHWILPHELTWPGIAAGVVLSAPLGLVRLRDSILGALVGFFAFWAMEWLGEKIFKKEALGAGDKDLLALIGAFLTWKPLLGIIFLSSLQGAVVGSVMLLLHGRAGPAPSPESPPTPSEQPSPGTDSPSPEASDVAPAPPPEGEARPEGATAEPVRGADGAAEGETREEGEKGEEGERGEDEEEDDWVPGPTNLPFGPWLSIAALEVMLLGPWLSAILPVPMNVLVTGVR
ncbi:Leader peptidase (Prepilin peptidase) [Cystobacter fuscus DSM 2262]|uniref:Prepilin leader peptidase/N-methyltransferase n=1 Tax=Cystobacter fuscus (strain ATCC 25194 / DSM 2262 / NBRC 100088 / M29) TaxID=1242864 RepID=S9PFN3_CYSF2|nr:A24 family peptidase [Cystobacter fuscus]EPX63190.1 Leader peptidase (Prepilin peptidase) [Cystobacter fuscus DSM 2262]